MSSTGLRDQVAVVTGASSGHLLNVSGVMGTKVRPTAGAYSGTKFALEARSEALRMNEHPASALP